MIPRPRAAADAPAHERRHAVAEREDPPGGGDDVEARREDEDQQEHRERIEQNPQRKPTRLVHGPIQSASADSRQHEQIEHECEGGERGGLPPRQEAQQKREAGRPDMDPLPRAFRVRRHDRIAPSVRSRPAASGVIV